MPKNPFDDYATGQRATAREQGSMMGFFDRIGGVPDDSQVARYSARRAEGREDEKERNKQAFQSGFVKFLKDNPHMQNDFRRAALSYSMSDEGGAALVKRGVSADAIPDLIKIFEDPDKYKTLSPGQGIAQKGPDGNYTSNFTQPMKTDVLEDIRTKAQRNGFGSLSVTEKKLYYDDLKMRSNDMLLRGQLPQNRQIEQDANREGAPMGPQQGAQPPPGPQGQAAPAPQQGAASAQAADDAERAIVQPQPDAADPYARVKGTPAAPQYDTPAEAMQAIKAGEVQPQADGYVYVTIAGTPKRMAVGKPQVAKPQKEAAPQVPKGR